MHKPLTRTIRHNVVYAVAWLAGKTLNSMPHALAQYFGALIGLASWFVIRKDQYLADRHLKLALPGSYDYNQRRLIGRNFYTNAGKNFADLIRAERHFEPDLAPRIEIDGLEHFERAHRNGNGVIGVTGHIGNWELLAVVIASHGFRVGVIGRQLYEPRLNKLLIGYRERFGLVNFLTTDPSIKLLRWLEQGHAIGVLIDTDSTRVQSMFVPSFGRPALTPVGQTVLGLKAGAAFVPMACVRTSDNGYKVIIRQAIKPRATGDHQRDVRAITAQCTAEIERIIRQYPDQWIWLANRWRTSPGEKAEYAPKSRHKHGTVGVG